MEEQYFKNKKTDEDYINEIYNIYDDDFDDYLFQNKNDYTTLINQSEPELYLNKSEYSFNLPKYIVNNEDSIFGTEVYKYLNFTNLQNTEDIIKGIQNDMNISSNIFPEDSICSNTMAKAGDKDEIEKSFNCSKTRNINTGVNIG